MPRARPPDGGRKKGMGVVGEDVAFEGVLPGEGALSVWTPVFARGKLKVYTCDPDASPLSMQTPCALNNSKDLAKFVEHVLPGLVKDMGAEFSWPNLPREVVHDKVPQSHGVPYGLRSRHWK